MHNIPENMQVTPIHHASYLCDGAIEPWTAPGGGGGGALDDSPRGGIG